MIKKQMKATSRNSTSHSMRLYTKILRQKTENHQQSNEENDDEKEEEEQEGTSQQ
jgi:hypothetical protein